MFNYHYLACYIFWGKDCIKNFATKSSRIPHVWLFFGYNCLPNQIQVDVCSLLPCAELWHGRRVWPSSNEETPVSGIACRLRGLCP